MPITYDITKDSFYLEGIKQERQKSQERNLSVIRYLLSVGKTDKEIMQILILSEEEYANIKKLL